jgi:hypothetical protein
LALCLKKKLSYFTEKLQGFAPQRRIFYIKKIFGSGLEVGSGGTPRVWEITYNVRAYCFTDLY